MANSGAAGIRAGRAYVEIGGDDLQLQRVLANSQARLGRLGRNLADLGKSVAAIGLGIAFPFAAATKTFANFDDAIRAVAAVAGAPERLEHFSDLARKLGHDMNFTATEVANMMLALARAGFDPSELEQMTAATLRLARASGTEAASAGETMASVIRQFGLEAGDATRISDALSATANKTSTSVYDLAEALKYAGPEAKKIGASLEETLAVLGTLGNAGIKGTMAGTAVRRVAAIMLARSAELKERFGVEARTAGDDLRSIVDVVDDIGKSMEGMGNASKAAEITDFFGMLGTTSAGILGRTADETRKLKEELENAGGTAKKTAEFMDAGVGGSLRKFWSALHDIMISLGAAVAPALSELADGFSAVGPGLSAFVAAHKDLFVVLGALAPKLLVAAGGLIAAGVAFKLAAVGVGILSGAIALLTSPIGIAAAAVAGLGYLWATSTEQGKTFGREVGKAFEDMAGIARTSWAGVVDAIRAGDMELAGEIATAGIEAAWRRMVAGMTDAWVEFAATFNDVYEEMVTSLSRGLVDATAGVFKNTFGYVGDALEGVYGDRHGIPTDAEADARRDALKRELDAEAAMEQKERARHRSEAQADAERSLKESMARLDALRSKAATDLSKKDAAKKAAEELAAMEANARKAMEGAGKAAMGGKASSAEDALAGLNVAAKGMFSGSGGSGLAAQALGVGSGVKNLEQEQKKTNAILGKLLDEAKKGGGAFK